MTLRRALDVFPDIVAGVVLCVLAGAALVVVLGWKGALP
jgi:hypothetical protein